MKLRKHQGNKFYKITWSQRTPKRGGKSERVVAGGGLILPRVVYTTGQNPTATLNAFLFGRDRTNIAARIEECAAPDERPVETVFTSRNLRPIAESVIRRSPRSTLSLMAAVAGISLRGFR